MTMSIAPLFRVVAVLTLCQLSSALLHEPSTRRLPLALFSVPTKNQEKSARSAALYSRNEATELLDVAIIGGGPTGLACALALLRARSSSSSSLPSLAIFESDSFQPKGASVVVQKSGWKALKCIDKETHRDAFAGSAPMSMVMFRNFSGKSLLPGPIYFMMRRLVRPLLRLLRKGIVRANSWHAFRASLKKGVQRLGSELGYSTDDLIRKNTTLISVDPRSDDERVLLTFGDGRQVAASAVLACDGTFSTVRKSLERFEDETNASSSRNIRRPVLIDEKKTVWRGMVPSIPNNGIGTFYIAQKEAKGVGATAALFTASGTTGGSSLAVILPTSVSGRAADTEDARNRLKRALLELDVPIDETLAKAIDQAEHMLEHKLFSRDAHKYPDLASGYDRIAYVGDSAHPLRPTGEGLSVAMEDAWTIGQLAGSSRDGILSPELFRQYVKKRQDRVNAICKAIRNVAESYYDYGKDDNVEKNAGGVKQAMKDHPIELFPL